MYRKTAVLFVCGSIRYNPKGFKENKLEKIIVMAPGHELWDGTIAFAAGCPWKAAAFLGQRRWSQTILKITKELLWPSFFQNAVTKNVVVGKEQLQINAAAWPWSAEESTRAPTQNFIDADARNTRKMAKKSKKCLTVGV